jgi:hypothetical protein
MSLLSRLDGLRDKDSEIRKPDAPANEQVLHAPPSELPTSFSTAIPLDTSTQAEAPNATTSPRVTTKLTQSPIARPTLAPLSDVPGDNSVLSISRSSMIKVGGGALTCETDSQAVQLALVQEIEGEDKNDARRLYRIKHALFDSVMANWSQACGLTHNAIRSVQFLKKLSSRRHRQRTSPWRWPSATGC